MNQTALALLIKEALDLACSFLSTVLQSVTDRQRESNRKLQTLININKSFFAEPQASRQQESDLAELFLCQTAFRTRCQADGADLQISILQVEIALASCANNIA